MKNNRLALVLILLMILTLMLAGCTNDVIEVTAPATNISIDASELAGYDYTTLFVITVNGQEVEVKSDYLTLPFIGDNGGTGTVTCTYLGQSAHVTLTVVATPPPAVVVVSVKQATLVIDSEQLATYDFTQLFSITSNGESVEVLDSYLTLNSISASGGMGTVVCNYQGQSATVLVTVNAIVFDIQLSQPSVRVYLYQVEDYDFLQYFSFSIDGQPASITQAMVTSDVQPAVGQYSYTVARADVSKTLQVIVVDDKNIEIVNSYQTLNIAISQLPSFDFTTLFSLYVDEVATEVTDDMIDASQLATATVGNSYVVSITFTLDNATASQTMTVNIVEDAEVVITAKNIITYPNSDPIDILQLFTIKVGDTDIAVTLDMISGSIDYSQQGDNIITITYQGVTAQANVQVLLGVVLNYATSDNIIISRGTNQSTYNFSKDFSLVINGTRYYNLERYMDTSAVDFATEGQYEVTLSVPYNSKALGWGTVNFDYYQLTITYDVLPVSYDIVVKQPDVLLPSDTTTYNELSNLTVRVNGYLQKLTQDASMVDSITCYAQIVNGVDFDKATQQISIAVYVFGPTENPVIVTYNVTIDSGIVITPTNKLVLLGDTLYTKDLFVITNGSTTIPTTEAMVSGKVNTFKTGVYQVTLNYQGMQSTARVVVINNDIIGVYRTNLTTIISTTNDEDYGETTTGGTQLPPMTINQDLSMTINRNSASIVDVISESKFIVKMGSYEYEMYYDDGIVILIPIDTSKLAYNNEKRPLIYFKDSYWSIYNKVVVNSSSQHVLQLSFASYSIDLFNLRSKDGTRDIWYALKIQLSEKTSVDTIYRLDWGIANLADDFATTVGQSSWVTLSDTLYHFTMQTTSVAKVYVPAATKKYAGMTFRGTIDGTAATLTFTGTEGARLAVGGVAVFDLSASDVSALTNGGLDYDNDIAFLYGYKTNVFSYKFQLQLTDSRSGTFSVLPKDNYVGQYVCGNKMIFIDGYGTGIVNYDTAYYTTTQLRYTVSVNQLLMEYVNTNSRFEYGDSTTFTIAPFGNRLTTKSSYGNKLNGLTFEITAITNGAIIDYLVPTITQQSDNTGKQIVADNITIRTSTGTLEGAAKTACIDYSKINFNVPGFYQLIIKIQQGSQTLSEYYSIEVVGKKYQDNTLVNSYVGVLNTANTFVIDQFGRAILTTPTAVYNGDITIANDNSFVAKMYGTNGQYTNIVGSSIINGLVRVASSGTVSFSDYFIIATGTVRTAGNSTSALRSLTTNAGTVYALSGGAQSLGEIVTVQSINGMAVAHNGVILRVEGSTTTKLLKVVDWTSTTAGLVDSDRYIGSYSGEQALTLDGFGSATLGGNSYSYTINSDSSIALYTANQLIVVRVNTADNTYTVVNTPTGNALLQGKQFSADYSFFCTTTTYTADTTFVFGDNGTVTVQSTSSTHDDVQDGCENDRYAPIFATSGTYSVRGINVTVTVAGYTFTFSINDMIAPSSIRLISSTLPTDSQGNIPLDEVFLINL